MVLALSQPAAVPAQIPHRSGIRTVSLSLCNTDDWRTVGTDSSPYCTGTCVRDEVNNLHGKTDNAIKVEHIVWLGTPRAETTRCGWMKFNTTAIPDNAVILTARIRYLVHYWEMSFNFRFTALNVDPVGTGARDLYQAITDGPVCADLPMGRLWETTYVNTAGVQHIQNSLSRNWVAFGLVGYNWSRILTERAWITGWNNNPRADSPWLDVDYSLTGAEEPPAGALSEPHRRPTIVRGVLWLSPSPLPSPSRGEGKEGRAELLDISGRSVMELRPGANDVRHLAPGVYFVPQTPGAARQFRVVVTR